MSIKRKIKCISIDFLGENHDEEKKIDSQIHPFKVFTFAQLIGSHKDVNPILSYMYIFSDPNYL